MFYEDLSVYEYCGYIDNTHLNVGWLGDVDDFTSGDIPKSVVDILRDLCSDRGNLTNECMGVHLCPFCDGKRIKGNGEVWIEYDGKTYIAPQMIHHYIVEHQYKPPKDFIEAVQRKLGPLGPR